MSELLPKILFIQLNNQDKVSRQYKSELMPLLNFIFKSIKNEDVFIVYAHKIFEFLQYQLDWDWFDHHQSSSIVLYYFLVANVHSKLIDYAVLYYLKFMTTALINEEWTFIRLLHTVVIRSFLIVTSLL